MVAAPNHATGRGSPKSNAASREQDHAGADAEVDHRLPAAAGQATAIAMATGTVSSRMMAADEASGRSHQGPSFLWVARRPVDRTGSLDGRWRRRRPACDAGSPRNRLRADPVSRAGGRGPPGRAGGRPGAGSSSSFEKMLAMCASTVFGREEQAVADRLVRAALGHQREDLALALREVVQRHAASGAGRPAGRRPPGSITEPPFAIRRTASANSSRSSTRSLSR